MRLTEQEAREARERAMAYEANMAVEGLRIHPDDRALMDRIDAEGIGYEEAFALADAHFGIVRRSDIAAE